VGGNGHIAGRSDSPQAAVDDLDAWTKKNFKGAERTHAWSAQDYQSISHVRSSGSCHVAMETFGSPPATTNGA